MQTLLSEFTINLTHTRQWQHQTVAYKGNGECAPWWGDIGDDVLVVGSDAGAVVDTNITVGWVPRELLCRGGNEEEEEGGRA